MAPVVSYPNDPGSLCCWVCGALVSDTEKEGWDRRDSPEILAFGKPDWRTAWSRFRRTRNPLKDHFNLQLRASEIDALDFISYEAWLSLCRLSFLVYKDANSRPSQYKISGIAFVPGAKRDKRFIVVPEDSRKAYIGAPEPMMSQCLRVTPIAHPHDASKVTPGDLEGYTIHSRCWTLIEKTLGKKGQVRMDILIRTLQRRWDGLVSWLSRYELDLGYVESDDYEDSDNYEDSGDESGGSHGQNVGFDDENGMAVNDDCKLLLENNDRAGEPSWPRSDPVHTCELPRAIRKCYYSKRKQRMSLPSRPVNLLSSKYRLPLRLCT